MKLCGYEVAKKEKKRKEKQTCEMSHIDRTNKDPTIYKAKPKAIILCLCVEHREFKVTWTKLIKWMGVA